MPVSIGQRFGPYEIVARIGAGGMGEVYRARDTRLDRIVAIKLVKPEFVERFEREAKIVASLNHAHICALHDVGPNYLVMEFVDGKPLDQLIPRHGMRLDEALRIASQIADGLSKAHSAGVVHRDLKPGNVMIATTGEVKILDFGLAKPVEAEISESDATKTEVAITERGMIVGTVAYMSPEQAQGRKLDARSDIFSFGAVLYEMVCGQRAFRGESKVSTLAAILQAEPTIGENIPGQVALIIRRCLRKDAARRWQSAADLKIAIDDAREESCSTLGIEAISPPSRSRIGLVWLAVAAGAALSALAAVAWWKPNRVEPSAEPILTRLTWDSGLTTTPAISPDGKLVAYASDRAGEGQLDIWVQQTGGGEPIRLTRDSANDHEPAFSPDSSQIAFRSDRDGGGVYLISALGGEERLVARHGWAPRFSPDGRWIAYRRGEQGGAGAKRYLDVVPAAGGSAHEVRVPLNGVVNPVWSPDSQALLAIGSVPDHLGVVLCLAPINGSPPSCADIPRNGFLSLPVLHAWATGNLYFSGRRGSSTDLYRQPLSGTGRLRGKMERLTTGTAEEISADIALSPDGKPKIVFANISGNLDIWSIPVEAATGKASGPAERITTSPAAEIGIFPVLQPMGIGYLRGNPGAFELRVRDLRTSKETVAMRNVTYLMSLDPSGKKVAYVKGGDLYLGAVGDPVAQKLASGLRGRPADWTADSHYLLIGSFAQIGTLEAREVRVIDLNSRILSVFAQHPDWSMHAGRFSPDGRWVCFFAATSPTTRQMFVAPFEPGHEVKQDEWIAVSEGHALDREPRWSADGSLIYFLSERDGFRCIWAQRLQQTKKPLGDAFAVFHDHSARPSMDVGNDTFLNGFAVVGSKIYVTMNEGTGSIWLAVW
jgi:eukaryotic-like serine/threonine-protein kinase